VSSILGIGSVNGRTRQRSLVSTALTAAALEAIQSQAYLSRATRLLLAILRDEHCKRLSTSHFGIWRG